MKRAIILLAACAAAFSAQAQSDDGWMLIATGDSREYHGQRGSAIVTEKVVSAVIRSRPAGNGRGEIHLTRAVVSRSECATKSGTLVMADLALTEKRYSVEFAIGAGSVASIIAEKLCNEPDAAPVSRKGVVL